MKNKSCCDGDILLSYITSEYYWTNSKFNIYKYWELVTDIFRLEE